MEFQQSHSIILLECNSNNMDLEFVLQFLGWSFVIVPTVIFLGVSLQMIRGAGKDDVMIRTLSLMGLTIFLIGAITLVLLYTTRLFS